MIRRGSKHIAPLAFWRGIGGEVFSFLIVFAIAVAVMWGVRTYLFTIYTVPKTVVDQHLRAGDRVLVNRLSRTDFTVGDRVVYGDKNQFIGQIVAVPGDTVRIGRVHYRLPQHCCTRCGCPNCRYYLIDAGRSQVLVHRHSIQGRAVRLFNFRLWQ